MEKKVDNPGKKVVLLVDDSDAHQYSLGKHLEKSGFAVFQANSGHAALALAASERPTVILLDINLPDMNGFEVCQRLKAAPETSSIPVIFHSATHDTASARSYATDLGAVSFLSYPIDIDHLVTVLLGTISQVEANRRSSKKSDLQ